MLTSNRFGGNPITHYLRPQAEPDVRTVTGSRVWP